MSDGPGAVAFDLDGCLIDSRHAILSSVGVAMAGLGLPELPATELEWLIGPPLGTGFAELLRRLDRDPAGYADLLVAYRDDYRRTMLEHTTLLPGMAEVVRAVGGTREVCVVTSKPAAFAVPILEHLGLLPDLAFAEGPGLDAPEEPKSVTLGRALARLPGLSVMVGDRHHDVEAGRAWGMRTVGVTWGMGSAAELGEAGADVVVGAPAELELELAG